MLALDLKKKGVPFWIDCCEPSEEDFESLSRNFGFNKTTIEECRNSEHYPKIEDYGDYLFLVSFYAEMLKEKTNGDYFLTRELNIFFSKDYLITVHRENHAFLENDMQRFMKNPILFASGLDYVLEEILDSIVQTYMPVIDIFDDEIERLEAILFRTVGKKIINQIFNLKKQIMLLRKLIVPQQEMLFRLSYHKSELIDERNSLLFRNVYDHFARLGHSLDSYRDLANSLFDAYRSESANKTNEIMKVLTIISTIMMPLTLLVGYYGMNFENIVEFQWKYGVLIVWGLMFFIVVGFLFYFRKKRWL